MISLKALVSHELGQWNGIFDNFSSLSLSSAQAASNAISWWHILSSMDNTNTDCFGQMELALPLYLDVVIFKNPVGNKGLSARHSTGFSNRFRPVDFRRGRLCAGTRRLAPAIASAQGRPLLERSTQPVLDRFAWLRGENDAKKCARLRNLTSFRKRLSLTRVDAGSRYH